MVGVFCLLLLPATLTQIRRSEQCFGDPFLRWPGGTSTSFVLRMGKGFNSAKQAELAKKLQRAKGQDQETNSTAPTEREIVVSSNNNEKDEEQIKMREEFGRLLAKNLPRSEEPLQRTSFTPPRPESSQAKIKQTGPKLKARSIKKQKKQMEATDSIPEVKSEEVLLQVGDKARRIDFESLIRLDSLQPLGPIGAAKLVPWVPPYLTEYLLILVDPRRQSNDLRATIQYLNSPCLSNKVQTIAISADDPGELKAWTKRAQLSDSIPIFVDPSLEWMTKYGCIDSDRWSTHVIVVNNDGVIVEHMEKVNPSHATHILADIIIS